MRVWWNRLSGYGKRNDRALCAAIVALCSPDQSTETIVDLLARGANPCQLARRPEAPVAAHTLFNLALGVEHFEAARLLRAAGARCDQDSVGIFTRQAHAWRDSLWRFAGRLSMLAMSPSMGTGPQSLPPTALPEPPRAWRGAALVVDCAAQADVDWWCVFILDTDFEEAAARVIAAAAPAFTKALDDSRVARGLSPGRPLLPVMGQAAMDALLTKTVDRQGETLDDDERRVRVETLLARGASPNMPSARSFHGHHTTLVGASLADWRPWLFEALMAHGGIVVPEAFTWLARTWLSLMDPVLLLLSDTPNNGNVRQTILLDAKAALEQHATIDWDQLIPGATHPLFHPIHEIWGIETVTVPVRLIDALAECFPAFHAFRQQRTLETHTAQIAGSDTSTRRVGRL